MTAGRPLLPRTTRQGRRLLFARKRQGLTIVQAAKKLGVNPLTIYRWETAKTILRPWQLRAILDGLEVGFG